MAKLTLKCSGCDKPMSAGKGSKTDGTQMCVDCRRKRRESGTRNCKDCGIEYPWRKAPRCSPCSFKLQKARAAAKGPCLIDGCNEPQFSRCLCSPHYWADHARQNPEKREYPGTCGHCGNDYISYDPRTKHCSLSCGVNATLDVRLETKLANRPIPTTEVCVYNAEHAKWLEEAQAAINEMHHQMVKAKMAQLAKSKRSPMRRAYEDGDMPGLLEAIKASSRVTETGCWEWGRQKDKSGYAKVRWGNKGHAVHRLAALAKYGQPESEPVVHHKCANRACCNPDHLQPISQRENMAEMLQRNYYLRRIEELEAALQEVAPGHQALSHLALSA